MLFSTKDWSHQVGIIRFHARCTLDDKNWHGVKLNNYDDSDLGQDINVQLVDTKALPKSSL